MIRTFASLAAVSFLALPQMAAAEPAKYRIDPAHFALAFSADHIGYADTLGMFLRGGGEFMFDEETRELSDLVVTIDMMSVFTNHDGRDSHLRNADFLDAENHPEAVFVMTSAEPETDTTGKVIGDLTFRGVTQPVTLDVELNKMGQYPFGNNYVIGVSATTTIKRSDFGSTYAVENGWVGDEIPLTIEIEAIRVDESESG